MSAPPAAGGPPRTAVIGAGSWGTALAHHLARGGHEVVAWARSADLVEGINAAHMNPRYLRGLALHPTLRASTELEAAVAGARLVVYASPAQHIRAIMARAAPHVARDAVVVSASKGIETSTLETMAEVLGDVLPAAVAGRACFLSGPSFAEEVVLGQPTAVTIASRDAAAARLAQAAFQTDSFRAYTSHDVMGVEMGGALKNVVAMAAGMVAGLGLGHNATAALITRGLAEIIRLAEAMGGEAITLSGLAGVGDLILTCTGGLSRNRHVGVELGKGRTLEQILADMEQVAEGVETTRAAHALARREGIEMPIVDQVHAVLFEDLPAAEALENLMLRDPKSEIWT